MRTRADAFRQVIASEARLEKLKVTEALMARDYAVQQMETLAASNRSRGSAISQLRQEKADLEAKLAAMPARSNTPGIIKISLEKENQDESEELKKLRTENTSLKTKVETLLMKYECSNPFSPKGDTPTQLQFAKVCSGHLFCAPSEVSIFTDFS